MALIDDLLFEVKRRVVMFTPDTVLPDLSFLGYDGHPALAVNGNTPGETLIVGCVLGSHYRDGNGKMYIKSGLPNTWFQVGQFGDVGGSESTRVEITQNDHGFTSDFVYHNGTAWVKALADDPLHVASHFAVASGTHTFYAYTGGEIDVSTVLDESSNALVAGGYYYLSQTVAGKASPVLAQSGITQTVLKVNSTDNATLIFGAALAEQAANQIRTFVNQAAHGFNNTFIRHNGTTWVAALADDVAHIATHFAVRIDDDKFYAVLYGDADLTGVTDDESNALTSETTYYLSQSVAGKVMLTPGALGVSQIVLRTKSATTGSIVTDQPGGGASGGGGDAAVLRTIVAQSTHGFTKDFVYHNGTTWTKAMADDEAHAATHFAMSIDTDNFYCVSMGEMNVSDVLDEASEALVAGEYYVLSQTVAGKVRKTIPTSGLIQFVLKMNQTGSASIIVEEPYGAEPTSPSTGFGELDVQDGTIDLSPPPAGLVRFYIKSGALYLRTSAGAITQALVPESWENVQFENQATTPVTPAAGQVRFFFQDGVAKVVDSAGTVRVLGADAGGGGINHIRDYNAETGIGDWVTYADGGATPVDGTGGTPSITLTATSVNPLRGTKSFLVAKGAANRLGDGISYPFTIEAADKGNQLFISFDYASNLVAEQVRVFILDVTNGNAIVPVTTDMTIVGNGKFVGSFLATQNTSYRLCIHVMSSSTTAFDLRADTISVTPLIQVAYVTMDEASATASGIVSTGAQTFAGTKTFANAIEYKNGTAFKFSFAGTPTANRTITMPDASGTVALLESANVFSGSSTSINETINCVSPSLTFKLLAGTSSQGQRTVICGGSTLSSSTGAFLTLNGNAFGSSVSGFAVIQCGDASGARIVLNGPVLSSSTYALTTATAANVVVDSTGLLQRSTSARKYKTNITNLSGIDTSFVYQIEPVKYTSLGEHDDKNKWFLGIVADQVDELEDPMAKLLVNYGAEGVEVEGFQYERLTVLLLKEIQRHEAINKDLEARLALLEQALG